MSNHQSSTDAADTPGDSGGPLVMLVLVYFAPSIIAFHCLHRKRHAIKRLNLLLGWTVFGWIVAFLWALASVKKGGPAMSECVRETAPVGEDVRTVFH